MITINTKTNKTIISCDTPKCKATLTVEGVRSRRKGYVLAIENDWRWKNANTHYCPTHKPANVRSVKAEEKVSEKVVAKKVTKPVTSTKKVTKSTVRKPAAQPMTVGVAVPGMVARSAKRSAAKK